MPANLTPEYRAAEAKLRSARTVDDRRAALEEMLAAIPKHKGTEKMQADIKRRLARLRHEEPARSGRHGFSMRVEPEGVAQLVLLGPPNSGKSSLLAALTRAQPLVAEYPFTTTRPQPGMMPYEDVGIQLIDLPPVTREHLDSWLPDLLRGADGALLFADACSAAAPDDVEAVRERLRSVRIPLMSELPPNSDPGETPLRTMLVVTKVDHAPAEEAAALMHRYAAHYPVVEVAAATGQGVEELKRVLWRWLQLVRVYAKPPGKPVDRTAPFVLPAGATVRELAERVHREIADRLQFARVWGGDRQGLRASRDFGLHDGDVVELHY